MLATWLLLLPGLLTLGSLPGLLVSGAHSENGETGSHLNPLHRYRRSTSCADKFQTIPHHTACLDKSSKASNSGVGSANQKVILDLHNKYRAEVSATNMLKLTWDAEIATIAQKWADNCETKHDSNERRYIPGYLSVGQNLAMGTKSWTETVDLWKSEVKDFTFGASSNSFEKVGHYTQLVWADTHRIGCGYALCESTTFYVCNYGPAGNMNNYTKPYKNGTKCAECNGRCTGDLCDCHTTCLNSGELIRANCTCKCRRDFYTGNGCDLDCDKVKKDPGYCSGEYGKKDCTISGLDCPNKCHVCPYSGLNYKEGSTPIVKRSDNNAGASARCDVLMAVTMTTLAWMTTVLF